MAAVLVGRGPLGPSVAHVGQLQAQLLLRQAHAEPLDLSQPGDRLDRSDGHAGLVVVVVRTEELDAEAGQLALERPVRRHAKQEEPVHERSPLGAPPVGLDLQRGVESGRRGEGARRKAERARGVRRRLAPRVRLIAGGSRGRRRPLRRRGRRRSIHADALTTGRVWLRSGSPSGPRPAAAISSGSPTREDDSVGTRSALAAARLMMSRAISPRTAGSCSGTRIFSSLPTGDTDPDTSRTATIAEATRPEPRQNPSRRRYRRARVMRVSFSAALRRWLICELWPRMRSNQRRAPLGNRKRRAKPRALDRRGVTAWRPGQSRGSTWRSTLSKPLPTLTLREAFAMMPSLCEGSTS